MSRAIDRDRGDVGADRDRCDRRRPGLDNGNSYHYGYGDGNDYGHPRVPDNMLSEAGR